MPLSPAENKLFGSPNDSESLESKHSPVKPKVQAASKRASVGGGLFDDEDNGGDDDDDDDFFSGKIHNKSTAGKPLTFSLQYEKLLLFWGNKCVSLIFFITREENTKENSRPVWGS